MLEKSLTDHVRCVVKSRICVSNIDLKLGRRRVCGASETKFIEVMIEIRHKSANSDGGVGMGLEWAVRDLPGMNSFNVSILIM